MTYLGLPYILFWLKYSDRKIILCLLEIWRYLTYTIVVVWNINTIYITIFLYYPFSYILVLKYFNMTTHCHLFFDCVLHSHNSFKWHIATNWKMGTKKVLHLFWTSCFHNKCRAGNKLTIYMLNNEKYHIGITIILLYFKETEMN